MDVNMANWTNIPDTSLEPGKPIRSVDGLALRDNPVAMAEGAPGAPRIQNPAYEDASITYNKLTAGPINGAANRSGSYNFSLSFGESSGTNFVDIAIDSPDLLGVFVMGQWNNTYVTGRWVRLYHNGAQVRQIDQGADNQIMAAVTSSIGVNTFRLEFQRPSGGVLNPFGTFLVFCPIR